MFPDLMSFGLTMPEKRRVDVPKPDKKGLYTKQDAAAVKKIKVETRRKNEDRKNRVSSYFIEDDFDYDNWQATGLQLDINHYQTKDATNV